MEEHVASGKYGDVVKVVSKLADHLAYPHVTIISIKTFQFNEVAHGRD
jgi:hypothetical protein